MNYLVFRLQIVLLLVSFPFYSKAQLTVNGGMTPQQLVQNVLLGQGVTVSNITFKGSQIQFGTFNGSNSNIGIANGVVMATGNITVAPGPNNAGGTTIPAGGVGGSGDIDLTAIAGTNTNDAAVLEFDFVPNGDTLRFKYVFGSEEYPEYVNSINDVFGFFISGPGITGPYSNNAQNIALIPGTFTPITINNVNNGTTDCSFGGPNGPCSNCAYYVNNCGGTSVQFDGFTTVLEAFVVVQCNETYHIKIAIADASDAILDSGVFLEASISAQSATGDSVIVEGCGEAVFTFSRPDTTKDFTIHFQIGGSATMGSDYTNVPDSIVIPKGQLSADLTIGAIKDNSNEPTETITFFISYVNGCGVDTVSATIFIENVNDLKGKVICTESTDGSSANLVASASGGYGPYSYKWSNHSENSNNVNIPNGKSTISVLTISDTCGNKVTINDLSELCNPSGINVFTPNNDGFNDTFYLLFLEQYPGTAVSVFNRWGKKIFESSDYKNDWKAENISDGVYYYVATLPDGSNITGNVTIMR
jgi:gliding motility-associated-like protein